METFGRRLEVDPSVAGQRQADVASALERDDLPQLRDERVERHVGEAHPEPVGKLSREDVLGMAEEA